MISICQHAFSKIIQKQPSDVLGKPIRSLLKQLQYPPSLFVPLFKLSDQDIYLFQGILLIPNFDKQIVDRDSSHTVLRHKNRYFKMNKQLIQHYINFLDFSPLDKPTRRSWVTIIYSTKSQKSSLYLGSIFEDDLHQTGFLNFKKQLLCKNLCRIKIFREDQYRSTPGITVIDISVKWQKLHTSDRCISKMWCGSNYEIK
eukprot:TRINITY_DN4021_c1_g1_i1.p1 TRINITY_DN4021_c1_g1~~TRINITY_DN4021_c1_g1_i1.p1  ORF type:complete len:200 (+),score=-10.27 TRINITY_DN4021_c1_g1_i1:414-1013(+)